MDMYEIAKVFRKIPFCLGAGAAIAGGVMPSGSEFYLPTKIPMC